MVGNQANQIEKTNNCTEQNGVESDSNKLTRYEARSLSNIYIKLRFCSLGSINSIASEFLCLR